MTPIGSCKVIAKQGDKSKKPFVQTDISVNKWFDRNLLAARPKRSAGSVSPALRIRVAAKRPQGYFASFIVVLWSIFCRMVMLLASMVISIFWLDVTSARRPAALSK